MAGEFNPFLGCRGFEITEEELEEIIFNPFLGCRGDNIILVPIKGSPPNSIPFSGAGVSETTWLNY